MSSLVGTCHCGRVRITLPRKPDEVTQCNCSLCTKTGFRGVYFSSDELRIEGETDSYVRADSNPAYIAQQARARLQFAMPGDTVYVVVSPNTKPATGVPARRDSTRVPGDSWNERLWGSIRAADSSP